MITAETVVRRVRKAIDEATAGSASFDELLRELQQAGRCAVVGGAVRDWAFHHTPRDVDIIVDTQPEILASVLSKHHVQRTGMGGFRVRTDRVTCDIWPLSETWAFRTSSFPKSIASFPQTAFFNVDGVAVGIDGWRIYEANFIDAWSHGFLDINYEPNPRPLVCVARAFGVAAKYELRFSTAVCLYVSGQVASRRAWEDVKSIYSVRYGRALTVAGLAAVMGGAEQGGMVYDRILSFERDLHSRGTNSKPRTTLRPKRARKKRQR